MKGQMISIGGRAVGPGAPVYVVAEIGINHNGKLDVAKRLIDGAVLAGCDAVKFQKRTPELCVPRDQWNVERDTPWGRMTYIEYRHKVELGERDFEEIDRYCEERHIHWFASCWDEPSVDFIERFAPPCYKAASASLTDLSLLRAMRGTGRPLMLSTGMSNMEEIDRAIGQVGLDGVLLAHSTSLYPCPPDKLNLAMIQTLHRAYPTIPVGYSGHEMGVAPTLAAVALGATFVERHITLDRAMWGTDQSASLELVDLVRLVQGVREIERSRGDGVKHVYDEELAQRKKLRRVNGAVVEPRPAPRHAAAMESSARSPA